MTLSTGQAHIRHGLGAVRPYLYGSSAKDVSHEYSRCE